MSVIGILFIISLGLLHIFAGRLHFIESVPSKLWLSFGAGVSIAYIFIDILPIINAAHATIEHGDSGIIGTIKHHVYLVALFGLVLFFSIEFLAKRSREGNMAVTNEDRTSNGVFWLHTGAFSLYNALLGYLLLEAEHHGLLTCALLFFALMLHFMINDHALHSHHKHLYDHYGRWILAASVVIGYVVGIVYMVDETSIALLWAFVSGGLILNVIKDELPQQRETSLTAFIVGLSGYSVVLLNVAH